MSRWYGKIGYSINTENEPGIWEPVITERTYSGDVYKNTRLLQQQSNSVNDNINVANQISIVADPYARDNFINMLYVEFMGVKWKITNVDVQHPRLVLTIGGQYNG